MKWNPPETAPRTGELILVDVGYPWAVPASWNGHHGEWAIASLQIGPVEGVWNDSYFETEHEKTIKAWMEFPEIKRQ